MAKPAQGTTAATQWDRDAALTSARILLEIDAIKFRHFSAVNAPPGRLVASPTEISSREPGRVGTTLTSISH